MSQSYKFNIRVHFSKPQNSYLYKTVLTRRLPRFQTSSTVAYGTMQNEVFFNRGGYRPLFFKNCSASLG